MKTIANLSHCTAEEINAIDLALKERKNLPALKKLAEAKCTNGKFVGSICALDQIAREIGITSALGDSQEAKLVLWLIFARLLEQGSRLSATRLAQNYAVGEVIGMEGFCEDDLYKALDWVHDRKDKIEEKLFKHKKKKVGKTPSLYLYDVSSSYLEGEQNELGEYGYNRDKKSGKKQIVYGALTDEDGDPVSIEVFPGNTSDTKTFSSQIQKVKNRFEGKNVTFVGDKGMIKSDQINDLRNENYNFITTITKAQIKKLIKEDVLQMGLFEDKLCEVETSEILDKKDRKDSKKKQKIRYIVRRNPDRAMEIENNRNERVECLRSKIKESNKYLENHPKAKVATREKKLKGALKSLKLSKFTTIHIKERTLAFEIDENKKKEEAKLDGCYAMKTDLNKAEVSKEIVHDRYKDLAHVEWEFRTQKTGYLEVRVIYLRKKERTIAHLFITMLAYKIERYLRSAWAEQDITVEEGLKALSKITTVELKIENEKIVQILEADDFLQELLNDANVILPKVLPHREVNVITRKKLKRSAKS